MGLVISVLQRRKLCFFPDYVLEPVCLQQPLTWASAAVSSFQTYGQRVHFRCPRESSLPGIQNWVSPNNGDRLWWNGSKCKSAYDQNCLTALNAALKIRVPYRMHAFSSPVYVFQSQAHRDGSLGNASIRSPPLGECSKHLCVLYGMITLSLALSFSCVFLTLLQCSFHILCCMFTFFPLFLSCVYCRITVLV